MTACALFLLGAIKSKFSNQTWYISGLQVLGNGALSATAAYLIGLGYVALFQQGKQANGWISERGEKQEMGGRVESTLLTEGHTRAHADSPRPLNLNFFFL